jgi:hypothetical protein
LPRFLFTSPGVYACGTEDRDYDLLFLLAL